MGDGRLPGEAPAEVVAEFQRLDGEIGDHDRRYYVDANPSIGDSDYDALRRRHRELLQRFPELKKYGRVRPVGDDRREKFQKRRHLLPMLSLNNTYSADELEAFAGRAEEALGRDLEFVLEPKIDGVAASLVYEGGKFAYALSRGDGMEGDDVSGNVLTIGGLPLTLPGIFKKGTFEVRGEIHIEGADFLAINAQREAEGGAPFANARNLAAGSLKLLDPQLVRGRKLRFLAYEIGAGGHLFSGHREVLRALREGGFPTNAHRVARGFGDLWRCVGEFDGERRSYPFATDGVVVKVDEHAAREELGAQASAPRWAIAYKFPPERVETVLKDILLRVGRTGVVTPVADLEPVELAGSLIRHATLHNADEIGRKDLRIGDHVFLEKAGEVIPAVVGVVMGKRRPGAKVFTYPSHCPACGAPLSRIEGEVAFRCLSADCPQQVARRLQHFASRAAMDIEGLGPQRIDQLLRAGLVGHFLDIFHLDGAALSSLPKLGERSVQNLLRAIDGSRHRPLWRLVHGLGIPHVGAQTAKLLTGHWPRLHALAMAEVGELTRVDGVGEIVAASVGEFFHRNRWLIPQLGSAGLSLADSPPDQSASGQSGNFLKKSFAITGSFPGLPREKIREEIERRGGVVRAALSSKIDLLLVGDSPGSKVGEAERLGIPMIDAETLNRWLGEP
jgi:DNA ligase (NAD+)